MSVREATSIQVFELKRKQMLRINYIVSASIVHIYEVTALWVTIFRRQRSLATR